MTTDLQLLLVHHGSCQPVLERAVDRRKLVPRPAPRTSGKGQLGGGRVGDLGDLHVQRWGVVAPPGDAGDKLIAKIRLLMELRAEQQQAEVRVYRSAPTFQSDLPLILALQWRDAYIDDFHTLDHHLPLYLLILGDLTEVPLAVQQALTTTGRRMVGRLAFDSLDQYHSYAKKVCRSEREQSRQDQARALFHTVRDGTDATSAGYDNLLRHVIRELRHARGRADGPIDESGSERPSSAEFLTATATSARPTLLFTLNHGLGAPQQGWSSAREQRRYQGAVSFGNGQWLDPDSLADRPFLPDGIWIMHSCFGAGTPTRSPYLDWVTRIAEETGDRDQLDRVLASLPRTGEPFIAHLPKTILAHPEGPLAFIGHVDLAWTFSFADPDDPARSRPGNVARMVADILDGHRVGQGTRALFDYLGIVITYLATLYTDERGDADADQRALWWMIWQDLAGYIVLGDPAVRLPLARPSPSPPQPARSPALAPLDRLERAIARVILLERPENAMRRERLPRDLTTERFEQLVERYRHAGRKGITE